MQELEVARRGQSELGKDRARGDRFAFKEAQNYSGKRVRDADTQSIQNSDKPQCVEGDGDARAREDERAGKAI